MDVANVIFQLLHISNLPSLVVLTPIHMPCTPFVDCAHLSADYVNSSTNYIDFSTNYANKSDNYTNIPNDSTNIITNLANISDISNLWIPNPPLLQLLLMDLLLICKSKINIVFTTRSLIYFSSLAFFICGFCISQSSSSSSVSKFST